MGPPGIVRFTPRKSLCIRFAGRSMAGGSVYASLKLTYHVKNHARRTPDPDRASPFPHERRAAAVGLRRAFVPGGAAVRQGRAVVHRLAVVLGRGLHRRLPDGVPRPAGPGGAGRGGGLPLVLGALLGGPLP